MTDPIVEKKNDVTPASGEDKTKGTPETPAADPSLDPVKAALDKVKKPKTEAEKAAFALQSNAKRAKELGLDPLAILGGGESPAEEDEDDSRPATIGDIKRIEQKKAADTALTLANNIENEAERELTIHHLTNTIKPSGNPQLDLANARSIVNGVKNAKLLEEDGRRGKPKQGSPGGSAPGKHDENEKFEPTADELSMMRPPFNLTKDDVIAARKKETGA